MEWSSCLIQGVPQFSCLEVIFARLLAVAGGLAGMILLVMLVFGGFRWMSSAGNPKGTEAARGTITAAIMGIVFIVGAYIILRIIEGFTGLKVTQFQIVKF